MSLLIGIVATCAAFCRLISEYGLLRDENHIYERCERLFDTLVKREGKPLEL